MFLTCRGIDRNSTRRKRIDLGEVSADVELRAGDGRRVDRAVRVGEVREDDLRLGRPDATQESKDEKGQGEIWLCPITKSIPVAVGRGENSGQTITYTNVVRRWIKLGDWSGKAETYTVPMKDVQSGGIDSAAVVVQSGVASAPKLMLGAAQIALR